MTSCVVHIRFDQSHLNSLSQFIQLQNITSEFSPKPISVPQAIYSLTVNYIEDNVIPALKTKESAGNIEKTEENAR